MSLPILYIQCYTFGNISKNNIGVFVALLFGILILFIPVTSIADAQDYDRNYKAPEKYIQDYDYENEIHNDYGYGYNNNDQHYETIQYSKDEGYYDEYKKDEKDNKPVLIAENKIPVSEHRNKNIVCEGTGFVVDSIQNCPFKCTTGQFEGFYVMEKTQCDIETNLGKNDQQICESCILISLDVINNQDLERQIIGELFLEKNDMWNICSAENNNEQYADIVCDVLNFDVNQPVDQNNPCSRGQYDSMDRMRL